MDWKRAARRTGWTLGGGALVLAVGVTSFCVALKADRRSNLLEVPDWTGRAREAAAAEASTLGLGFEVSGQQHDVGVAADHVLHQEPAPGTQVRKGRTIRVVVSLGGETITVPSLIGQPSRQAELEIRRQGLIPGVEARVHGAGPAGQVVDQFPSGGSLTVGGERVDRLVSDGPRSPRFVMPELAGRPLREAQEWINLCGFRNGAVRRIRADGRASGTVVGQSPLPGRPIERRDVVELTVAE